MRDVPPAPRDYGRPGLSHTTLWGANRDGASEVEVWRQAFAPGVATPVHRHDCEEVFVVLSGAGELRSRDDATGEVVSRPFGANATLSVPPDVVHQVRNDNDELLVFIVVISRPPVRVYVYEDFAQPDEDAQYRHPYLFDEEYGLQKGEL